MRSQPKRPVSLQGSCARSLLKNAPKQRARRKIPWPSHRAGQGIVCRVCYETVFQQAPRAKPGKTCPGPAALKLTRPSGSGDRAQNSPGHSIPGFALTGGPDCTHVLCSLPLMADSRAPGCVRRRSIRKRCVRSVSSSVHLRPEARANMRVISTLIISLWRLDPVIDCG